MDEACAEALSDERPCSAISSRCATMYSSVVMPREMSTRCSSSSSTRCHSAPPSTSM